MSTTIKLSRVQRKGQVTIPVDYRQRLGIKEGDFVAFTLTDTGLLITRQQLVTADTVDKMTQVRDALTQNLHE